MFITMTLSVDPFLFAISIIPLTSYDAICLWTLDHKKSLVRRKNDLNICKSQTKE